MTTNGQESQMMTSVTAGSAHDVLASHVGPVMPTRPRILLTMPYVGLNNVDHRTPATAVDTTSGRKNSNRIAPTPLACQSSKVASRNPPPTVGTTPNATNRSVRHSD